MKNFKKMVLVFLVAMVVMAGTLPVSAGQGKGQAQAQGQGLADGSGPMVSIYDGVPTTVDGVVSALPAIGDPGLKVDIGGGVTITVYGTGSSMVWEALGCEPLTVDEEVSIAAYEVEFSDGSTKLIAVTVTFTETVDETDVERIITLRDDDGRPAWRGGIMGAGGKGSQGGNMGAGACQRLRDGSCLQ